MRREYPGENLCYGERIACLEGAIDEAEERIADLEKDKRSLAELAEMARDCAPFLKEYETPAQCIERNRKDVDSVLTLLIDEKRKTERLSRRRWWQWFTGISGEGER